MTDLSSEELGEFFDYIWGTDGPSFIYVPVKNESWERIWQKFMFAWPRQREGIIRHVFKHNATGGDTYFSPVHYSAARPIKENVKGSRFLWADLDGNAPADWSALDIPEPTLLIQSSLPGHEHAYWRLDEFMPDLDTIEDRNNAIARYLEADLSGWDANQVLRVPGTMNYKRGEPVEILSWDR